MRPMNRLHAICGASAIILWSACMRPVERLHALDGAPACDLWSACMRLMEHPQSIDERRHATCGASTRG